MAQGNDGYKSGKVRFGIHDILHDLRYPQRFKYEIDLEDYLDPFPCIEYLVTFAMGCKRHVPDCDYFEKKLEAYLRRLRGNGWTTRKINGMVLKVMNRMNLGVEIYRCMGGKFIR